MPAAQQASDDQGMLQVQGSTGAHVFVLNENEETLLSQPLNKTFLLQEGAYKIRVNNSTCSVEIRAGEFAVCSTGTLTVSGSTSETYYVFDSTGVQLGYETLRRPISCFPGRYTVSVNSTEVTAKIRPNELTEIHAGSVVVSGTTDEYYYVLGSGNKQLNYNTLRKPLAFLPGEYEVKVNNTSMKAEVLAGKVTELQTGNLLVNGLTEEYYYVTDSAGNALNFQTLNKPLAFFPGRYQVKVNNTTMDGSVLPGQTTEFATGSLTLTGAGTGYYYVLDQSGNQLNYNSLNRSLSFFPAEYIVKLGASTHKATVSAGQRTALNASN